MDTAEGLSEQPQLPRQLQPHEGTRRGCSAPGALLATWGSRGTCRGRGEPALCLGPRVVRRGAPGQGPGSSCPQRHTISLRTQGWRVLRADQQSAHRPLCLSSPRTRPGLPASAPSPPEAERFPSPEPTLPTHPSAIFSSLPPFLHGDPAPPAAGRRRYAGSFAARGQPVE